LVVRFYYSLSPRDVALKPLPVLILVLVGTAFGAVALVSMWSAPVNNQQADAASDPAGRRPLNPLEISEQGPYPRAVLRESLHRFAGMQIGATGSHSFAVRNDGDAPLLLQAGKVTCKCTFPTVSADPVLPGESVEILLTWQPESAEAQFHQSAEIWTNDPENEQLTLQIAGSVAWLIYPLPSAVWQLRRVSEDSPVRFDGSIISTGLDEFQVIDYKCSVDAAEVEIEPISPTELAERSAKTGAKIKSGYNIKVAIAGPVPIGRFQERLTFVTDIEHVPEMTVLLSGNIPGPYFILGNGWNGDLMKLNLGNVKASQGKTVTLSMFMPRQDEPMQVEVKEKSPAFLQLVIEPDESFKAPTKERYLIKLTVPPGSPAGSEIAMIRLETNRESIPELELSVEMVVK